MNEQVAYEMALLLKENRELKKQIEILNNTIEDYQSRILRIDREAQEQKRQEALATHSECDTTLQTGDHVLLTAIMDNVKYKTGCVVEVKSPCKTDKYGYVSFGAYTLNDDGTKKMGAGSILCVKSKSWTWRKVSKDIPLTIIHASHDYSSDYRYCETTYTYENLYTED